MQCEDILPKVSVIIPIYNVEPYLRRCVDSVISQSMENIEIILVDDGSTDGGAQICDEYAAKDCRVKVCHKQNEGLSSARNIGIEMATAPFILFVDGDDWVESVFCETPYRIAISNSADMVLFSYNSISMEGRISKADITAYQGTMSELEALRFNVYSACFAWIGLYRRELFDDIRFPIGMTHEDVGTTHRLIHASNRVCLIQDHLYNYRVHRPGSITETQGMQGIKDVRAMLTSKINDLCSWGYEELAQKDALTLVIKYGWRQEEQKSFVRIVRKIKGLWPAGFDWKQKLFLTSFKISPLLFDFLCFVTKRRIRV